MPAPFCFLTQKEAEFLSIKNTNLKIEGENMSNLVRIQNKARGSISFSSLGFLLEHKGFSHPMEETAIKTNSEVNSFLAKGLVAILTEPEYEKMHSARLEEAEAEANNGDVASALELDSPTPVAFNRQIDEVQRALDALKNLVDKMDSDDDEKPAPKKHSKAPAVFPSSTVTPPTTQPTEKDEGPSDLPMNPVAGMKPWVSTDKYLALDAKGRKKWIKECRDIGMLRDVAMWESDAKLKIVARKAAMKAERVAEGAAEAAIKAV